MSFYCLITLEDDLRPQMLVFSKRQLQLALVPFEHTYNNVSMLVFKLFLNAINSSDTCSYTIVTYKDHQPILVYLVPFL